MKKLTRKQVKFVKLRAALLVQWKCEEKQARQRGERTSFMSGHTAGYICCLKSIVREWKAGEL